MDDLYLRSGIFLAPFHNHDENPTLSIERDLELLEHLDRLNYHEAWIGEHHSGGFELIACPEMFIAAAGPDQGAAFVSVVGKGNATGMMVPNGWYPGYANAVSKQMVKEYVEQFGGSPSGVNADVAEAYSVGQVVAQAVTATGGTDNAKIITYLHSGVTISTVQGPVRFDSLGKNSSAAAFTFQWQKDTTFKQVLPEASAGSVPIINPKPNWTS